MNRLRVILETLGGVRPLPQSLQSSPIANAALGLWWAFLLLSAFSFAGRTVKFVYIDF